jgi:arylsulfatase A-like enzyme
LAAGKVNHDLGTPDPRLWDENGPDCGVLGTPFIGNELDTLEPGQKLEINRGRLRITLPANGGLSWVDRPNNTWNSFDWAPLDVSDDEFPDGKIANWGVEQLSKKHDKPLLLAIGFYKPHQPFFAPRKYFEMHDSEKVRLPKTIGDDLSDVSPPGKYLATKPWTSGTHATVTKYDAWRDAVRAYLATVSFVDALVGEVVAGLDSGPHADNTWIVLWSDHGWSLGEKQHWGKHVPWTECVRVPLIVIPPRGKQPSGFKAGSRCEARVSLLDLYPTLTDISGLPARKELEGRSLLPLIANPNAEWNEAVVSTIGRGTHSVATDRWRYIRYFDGSEELYDLRKDTEEWSNIASQPENKDIKRRLAAHIPQDKRLKRFVRWGSWKCVFPVKGKPMLFDYEGDFGISEQNDVAENHPDILRAIQSYVEQAGVDDRRVAMPTPDNKEEQRK